MVSLICSRVRTNLRICLDMFPRTPKLSKKPLICFRLRRKCQNCCGYVPRYERTPKKGWFDIHSVFATNVETIALLSRETSRLAKDYIKVGIDAEEYYKIKGDKH